MEALKFLEILCPGCKTEYRIPVEHCGKDAVCCNGKCGIIFKIPNKEELLHPEEIIAPEEQEGEVSTSTVKIERRNIGMIPKQEQQKLLETGNFVLLPDSSGLQKKKRIFRI